MHISEILKNQRPSVSFEFFPPKNEAAAIDLFQTVRNLQSLNPSFVSVTYGAGGSTRSRTHDLVLRILRETPIPPIPHLTCVCHDENEVSAILTRYAMAGVDNILALRGDPPHNMPGFDHSMDRFQFAADLVAFIRRFNEERRHPGAGFGIGVAGFPEGHPETLNRLHEMDFLKAKIDAGADYICTQLFFDNHDFYDFRERCELAGIAVPIIAGIMPITTRSGMRRMADLAAGAHFPAPLLRRLGRFEHDPEAFASAGTEFATEQCRDLLENDIAGLHFYTLNKSRATMRIATELNLGRP